MLVFFSARDLELLFIGAISCTAWLMLHNKDANIEKLISHGINQLLTVLCYIEALDFLSSCFCCLYAGSSFS